MTREAAPDNAARGVASIIAARMAGFVRLLHDNGFPVGPAEIADALLTLARMDDSDIGQARLTLRTLFASSLGDWRRFDDLFDAYWLGRARKARGVVRLAGGGTVSSLGREKSAQPGGRTGTLADYMDWREDTETGAGEATPPAGEGRAAGASTSARLAKADFGRVTDPDEIERLHALAAAWAARIRYRLSRRRRPARRGARPMLRGTFRRSVATAGLPLRLVHVRRKPKPFTLIVFVDVSGSMDLYSLFFTRFVHALTAHFARVEAFIFHTRLVPITAAMRTADPVKLMEKMALISQGWSGGTRIGEALATFNDQYAGAAATSRTLAIIVSDGFDTGTPERLAAELARLKRRARRLVWLNPLLGRASYAPLAAGMAAALPHLDLFAPAHNLESLAAIEAELARL